MMSVNELRTETVNCPYCFEGKSNLWAMENGYKAVKCIKCGLVYVNPRPVMALINESVKTGIHRGVDHGRTAVSRRVGAKVNRYKKIFALMFADVWERGRRVSWLDVGAGYGEVVEAISLLAPSGSKIEGIEPMEPKAVRARARGLCIRNIFLDSVREKYDFVSIINVFSHIPDFRNLLREMKNVMTGQGEILIETGNAGDLNRREDLPFELDLPDHLVFAGEKHIIGYLCEAGFSITAIKRMRNDGLINFGKNILKRVMGRNVYLALPYTSPDRSILIRARLG